MAKRTSTRRQEPKKDHPDQAVDTALPDDSVDEEAFKALQDNYEGDPDEENQ